MLWVTYTDLGRCLLGHEISTDDLSSCLQDSKYSNAETLESDVDGTIQFLTKKVPLRGVFFYCQSRYSISIMRRDNKRGIRVLLAIVGVTAVLGIIGATNEPAQSSLNVTPASSQSTSSQNETAPTTSEQPVETLPNEPASQPSQAATAPSSQQSSTNLSNDNTYINSDGNTVQSPAYSTDNSVPAGATAQCGDGTYSFSQHHSGTCSHHGGVAEWL